MYEFRAIKNNGGKMDLVPLSPEQEARKSRYLEALWTAERSQVPHPIYSNFHVKSSISTRGHSAAEGGNREYGFCQALHGEESLDAVNAYLQSAVKVGGDIPIIAFYGENMDPSCCGNCRDVLFDGIGNGEFVAGPNKDGVVMIATFDDLRFDDFKEIEPVSIALKAFAGITHSNGEVLRKDAFSGGRYPERNYSVCLVTRDADYFGAHDVTADYHTIYAGRDAVRQARRARDPFVKSIHVVAEKKPYLLYKDRQHFVELNADAEILSGQEFNPVVFLYSLEEGRTWKAPLKDTLPFPFVVTEFGPAFVENYRKWAEKAYAR